MKESLKKSFKDSLDKLIERGNAMMDDIQSISSSRRPCWKESTLISYEIWYSGAKKIVSTLLPERLKDFEKIYQETIGKGHVMHIVYYVRQLGIVQAARNSLDSHLYRITQLLHADLLDNQIERASELLRNGFTRAAGMFAGVALESHLKQMCIDNNIKVDSEGMSITAYSDRLKKSEVIDHSQIRHISYLAGLRNKCVHVKEAEPIIKDVQDLIYNVKRIISGVYEQPEANESVQ